MAMTKVIAAATVHDSKTRANARETLDRRINQTMPAIKVRPAQIGATHTKISSTPYQNGLRLSIISPAHGILPGLPPATPQNKDTTRRPRNGGRPLKQLSCHNLWLLWKNRESHLTGFFFELRFFHERYEDARGELQKTQ
jgi:hypothetical protein